MESRDFIQIFGAIAKQHGFESKYGGWFKISSEVIHVLDLQKSNYGNFFYLNIKIFVNGLFGKNYAPSKQLIKNDIGNVFLRQPEIYSPFFNLENNLEEMQRKEGIENMFNEFILPLISISKDRNDIKQSVQRGDIFVLDSVRNELGI